MISTVFQFTRRNVICFLLISPAGLVAQKLGDDERSAAMTHLYVSRMKFLNSIAGLSPEQLAFKAGPDRWSIAECAEHITLSEDLIFKMAERALAVPAAKREPAVYLRVDQQILKTMVNRDKKGKAPEAVGVPTISVVVPVCRLSPVGSRPAVTAKAWGSTPPPPLNGWL